MPAMPVPAVPAMVVVAVVNAVIEPGRSGAGTAWRGTAQDAPVGGGGGGGAVRAGAPAVAAASGDGFVPKQHAKARVPNLSVPGPVQPQRQLTGVRVG